MARSGGSLRAPVVGADIGRHPRVHTVPSLDLYRELEVDPAATPETIEASWRSLVKRHHPDIAPDRAAAIEKIKRLNLAHDWLSDRALRSTYDLARFRRRHQDLGIEPPVRRHTRRHARTTRFHRKLAGASVHRRRGARSSRHRSSQSCSSVPW